MNAKSHHSANLARLQCRPCTAATPALGQDQINSLLAQLDGWGQHGSAINKIFDFKNFHETMAFVNAVAWVSNQQDHHPELMVGYNKCKVEYMTHAVHGLSENDFICAAKVDALFQV
jgi:4a-hydroxytetrahydrobiopterin dehydratase